MTPLPSTFIYIDPDTGMAMVMVQEDDGFRPVSAAEEAQGIELGLSQDEQGFDCTEAIEDFVARHERAYCGA